MKTVKRIGNGRFSVELHVFGSSGEPLLFMHGAGGLFGDEAFLEELGRDFRVIAPHLPGYGESTGAELIEDVFDTTQFHHQLMDDLGIESACVIGHSMGGMLAAEMAAMDVRRVRRLVLAAPAGLWLDEHPIPDLFTASPNRQLGLLFHDPASPAAQAMAKMPEDRREFAEAYIERIKRLTVATKFLWPIPDRGLGRRLWRVAAPTLLLWGESDRYIPAVYCGEFGRRIGNSREAIISNAGHMVMYERPQEFCAAVRSFFKE